MDDQESRSGDKAPPGTLSFLDQYDLISKSSFFSADFYLRRYKDVAAHGVDPVVHYLEHGAAEGRDPHEQFDTAHYLEQCAKRGLEVENPLLHFLIEGRELGISPKRDTSRRDERWAENRGNAAQAELEKVRQSGLFDWHYYNNACGTRFQTEDEALRHFFFEGYRERRRPNLYFDPAWYLNLYPDVRDAGVQPLYHFVASGDLEGRQPSRIFDAAWYRCAYAIPENENSLAHYLAHRTTCRFSPLPDFDVEHYGIANKDVRDAGIDAFEHFLFTGYREGRNPSPSFNIRYYARRYLGGDLENNPFLHYLDHKHQPGVYGAPPDDEASIPRAVKQFTRPSADFEEFKPIPPSAPRKAKVLAYYLPQFHTFPENDRWWGGGFTEWTNIARGVSRYKGHYQPRIPRDLGFYSLDSVDTLKRQVAMAKGAGIYGFVYYYYYFNGKRLMEKPLEQFLDDPSIDMPFCLLWANENWTRRWDGAESDVLISQDYEPDDDEHVVESFVHHFKDKRYIRINGRPLLMIYRADTIPEPKKSLRRWRALFKERFNEDPILIMAQFHATNPTEFGFDGAVEFPPHKLAADMPQMYEPPMYEQLELIDVEFTGQIFSYDDVVARSVDEPMPSFPLIKTAVPSWDNDARRQGDGLVLQGSTPAKYQAWLGQLIEKAREKPFFGEHFVCVNAWNEWCEAAYLEPDLYYGSAYLNATGRAVVGAVSGDYKLLLVGHDAWPHGAQHLLVNIARRLQSDCGVQVEFLLLDGGTLEETYRDVAPVTMADGGTLAAKVEDFKMRGFAHAIVNTVTAGQILPHLRNHGIDSICLVHELPDIIRDKKLAAGAKAALELSRHAVFPAAVVRDQVAAEVGVEVDDRMLLLPQGMYRQLAEPEDGGAAIREELGIAAGEKLVLGIGYADLHKGFDLFLQLWRHTNHLSKQRVHFCWIGDLSPSLRDLLTADIDGAKSTGSFHMPGYRNDVEPFLFTADAFVLTSREDPFPAAVQEALGAGLPVLVFDGSGGMPDFLARHRMGTVVPPGDVIAMGKKLARLVRGGKRAEDAARRKEFVRTHLDFGDYVRQLLRLAIPRLPAVSVAIPNYNYARFMPARLASVFQQTHPVHEILVLDDCSSDDSLDMIPQIARAWNRKLTLLSSEANSGSVFAQWRKAAELATGEYLWIAEADDLTDPEFLGAVVGAMQADPAICLGFSDSRTINYDGSPLWDSYKDYYEHDGRGTLATSATFDGDDFVRRHLAVRNLILNVSAVVWRREALLRALDACQEELKTFRMAGDWRLYLEVLTAPGARIAYIADPLNVHRRHAESVTHALEADKHIAEIAQCHALGTDRLKLPPRVRSLQTKYRQSVEDQLNAAPTDTADSAASKRRRAKPVISAQLRKRIAEHPVQGDIKAIAFYLPQFHPIPENDRWWGKGFTEWRNVKQATPLFPGHQQPRIPTDLGYYDLRVPAIREAQADLARSHGIHGFCYYYYWFAGKRLLERPLDEMLESGSPDFPFCLCWANESWSRRWDGSEREVLMEQKHSPELDLEFAGSVIRYFRDPRYIRVDGKPMLIVYRPNIIPDLSATLLRWRELFREEGIGEVHLVSAMTFGYERGVEDGFDAEVQFPPHGMNLPERSPEYKTTPDFNGKIVHYEDVARSLIRSSAAGKTRYFTVMLNWDNTSRKKMAGHVYHGFSLDGYERWLQASLLKTEQLYDADNQFVFINAWNEWAEGTYLEPDTLYGRAPLERTRDALGAPSQKADDDLLQDLLPLLSGEPGARLMSLAAAVIEERGQEEGNESLALLAMAEPRNGIAIQSLNYQYAEDSLLWLESIVAGALVDGEVLTLSGFVISRAARVEIVEVLLGGEVVSQTLLTQTREDVFDYHSRLDAIRCPNSFSVSLPRADLAARLSYGTQRLQISLRALGPNAQPVIGVDIWLAKHILPSTLQLMTDRGLLDAEIVAQIRNDAKRCKPHLFVVHDPYPAGAQLFILRFLRWLKAHAPDFDFETLFAVPRETATSYETQGVSLAGGFAQLGPVHFLEPDGVPENQEKIRSGAYRLIYLNSLATIRNLRGLPASDTPLMLHVHELRSTVKQLLGNDAAFCHIPGRFIACSRAVERMLTEDYRVNPEQVTTIHAFVPEHGEEPVAESVGEILPEQPGVITILLAGSVNWRKGAHILGPVAQQLARVSTAPFRFVWVGDRGEPDSFIRLEHEFDRLGLSGSLHIAGRHDGIARFYAAADLFLLPSMEDPFPLVMLEAGMARLPIVAFEGSGGAAEFIHDNGGGITVPYLDVRAMADAIERLMADAALREAMGENAYASAQKFSEAVLAPVLLRTILQTRDGGGDLPVTPATHPHVRSSATRRSRARRPSRL